MTIFDEIINYNSDSSLSETPDDLLPSPFNEDRTDEPTGSSRSGAVVQDVRQWYMVVAENTPYLSRGDRLTGQFTPQQIQQNVSSIIVEGGGYSRSAPIIQWIGGQIRTFTFQARLFSLHRDDNTAEDKLQRLNDLMEPHAALKRPPLVNFFWGTAIPDGFPCFVESLGGISYDEIRQDGSLRGVTLSITLKKFTQYRLEQVPTAQAERTPVHIVRDGQTYEMIAEQHYGDPLIGVLLRQRNPRFPMSAKAPKLIADLQVGEEVKIYPRNEMLARFVRPQCHILREDNFIQVQNRRRFFELRSKEKAAMPKR